MYPQVPLQMPPSWPYNWPPQMLYPGQMPLVPRQLGQPQEPKNIPPGRHPADHILCPPPVKRKSNQGGQRKVENREGRPISEIDWKAMGDFWWNQTTHPWDQRAQQAQEPVQESEETGPAQHGYRD